jgi:UDP-3-O-[3-hydroxymyristoyl] glucosamine N-acyltransferase
MSNQLTVAELVRRSRQHIQILNDDSVEVQRLASLSAATPGSLTFARADRRAELERTQASVIATDLTEDEVSELRGSEDKVWILVDDPRLFVAEVADVFDPPASVSTHPTATIEAGAVIAGRCSIGPSAVISAGALLGIGCVIGAGAVIGSAVTLSDDVEVGPGSVLGHVGFGLARAVDGWHRLPHVGRVRVGPGVTIGANCSVDRGSLSDTVLEAGVCLSSGVSIAHNVTVGERTIVAGRVMVSGSASIGADVWLAPGTTISNGVHVGDGAMTGVGAVVIDDVPPSVTVAGCPARILGPRRHFL